MTHRVISADIEDCVPPFEDGTLDDLMKVLMERRHAGVGPALRQVIGNGQSAVTIVLRAQREFRNLLLVSSDPQGAHRGCGKSSSGSVWAAARLASAPRGRMGRIRSRIGFGIFSRARPAIAFSVQGSSYSVA